MTPAASAAFLLLLIQSPGTQPESWRWNLPEWSVKRLEKAERQRELVLSNALNPYYLQADLNGDCRVDLAVLVRNTRTQKAGIAVLLRNQDGVIVLGAGSEFGNGGDDFSWMDVWSVFPKGTVEREANESRPPPRLLGDGVLVRKSEAASALIYWNGKSFRWYQQGD